MIAALGAWLGALCGGGRSLDRVAAAPVGALVLLAALAFGCGWAVGARSAAEVAWQRGALEVGLLVAVALVAWLWTELLALRLPRARLLRGWLAVALATGPVTLLVAALSPSPSPSASPSGEAVGAIVLDSRLLALVWSWRLLLLTRVAGRLAGLDAIRRQAGVAMMGFLGGGCALFLWHYERAGGLMVRGPRPPVEQAHLAAAYEAATALILVAPIAIAMSLAVYIMLRELPEEQAADAAGGAVAPANEQPDEQPDEQPEQR